MIDPIPYHKTSRILCPANYYKKFIRFSDMDQYVTTTISTASPYNFTFKLQIDPVKIYIKLVYSWFITSGMELIKNC